MGKHKKPSSTLDVLKTVVEILSGLATIVSVLHSILKG